MKNDKKIIAQLLLEIAKDSTTELIEDAKLDKEIIDAAKKMGMIIPSPDFAIFKTKWADIDKKNLNDVSLPKKAVEEGIQTLVGKNLNFEHLGAYNVCGFCLSVKTKDNIIECIQVFYRSLYPDKFEELKEKIKTKEAAVSFEIYNVDEKGNSVIKVLEDGTKVITKIHAHGTGLLLVNPPACPTAKIFHLEAKKEIQEAEKIVDKVFGEDLIFAEMAIEKPICKNCGKCNCKKEEKIVELIKLFENVKAETDVTFDLALTFYYASEEEQKVLTEDAAKWTRKFINGLPDSAFAVIEPAYPEKIQDKNARHLPHHNGEGDLGKDKSNANLDLPHYKNALARANQIKPISDSISAEELQKKASAHLERHKDALEKSAEEPKTEGQSTETKPVEGAETKVDDKPKVDETQAGQEQAQPQMEVTEPKIIVKTTTEYREVRVSTYVDGTPSGTDEIKGYYKKTTEYKDGTKDEVEEETKVEKKYTYAELEEAVNKAKKELEDLHKAELETKTNEVKVDLEKKIGEKETEVANLKKEIEDLKKPKEIAEEKPEGTQASLEVGNTEIEEGKDSRYKDRQKKINRIAYGHD